ncbi:MAG: GNAT family N-acetyltransferase, partial [Anaerolineae bacterium]|nr:GNAT family N-acetyltransferase [Anaerolineae bacterium]
MSELQIREASLEDVAHIVHHRRRMFEDMGYSDAALLDRMSQRFEVWLRERMADGRYLAWVAVSETGAVAAGAGLWLMDWPPHVLGQSDFRGNIVNVYTEPEYRRQGLARRLTQTALDWCWGHDLDVVILHASDHGRPIYESLGFRPTNEMR